MQQEILYDAHPGPLSEVRSASTAGGGTALTTTAAVIPLPDGTSHVGMIARNFATAVVVKFALNPFVQILKTTDGFTTYTDYSKQGQSVGGSGIAMGAQPTLNNGGMLYLGAHLPFRGFVVDMSASVNAVAATLLGQYWNGTGWTSLSITDGTASGGAPFAQDGNITWTMPAAGLWAKAYPLNTLQQPPAAPQQFSAPYSDKPRYWTRFTVSAALTTTVLINTMFALNRSTTYGEAVQDSLTEFRTFKGVDGVSCVELLTDAGTANAVVNCYVASSNGGF